MKPITPLKAIALAVAALTLQAQAIAAPSEAQLNSIKLYSDVTIAQDSVTGWGPWTEFEPPAAGNPPLNLPPANSDLYRRLPQVANGGGDQGALLGFSTFYTVVNDGGPVTDGQPNAITLTGTALSGTTAGNLLPNTLQLQVNPVTGVYPPPSTVQLELQADGTYRRVNNQEFTQLNVVASPDAPSGSTAPVTFYQLISYIAQGYAEGADSAVQGVGHTGVIGITTSQSDMDGLLRGNVSATYNGHSLVNQGSLAPMTMTVNFGQSTWTGTWNNGADANGAVGFSAAGSISGSQFSSTPGSITALDSNNVSGSVRGAFYGTQAAAVGGIADITKNSVRQINPFIAFRQPSITPTPNVPVGGGAQ